MAEENSEIQTADTTTIGNILSPPKGSDSTWNYVWDDKLCKTTLKFCKTVVYTPPVLPLLNERDPNRYYVCSAEGCEKVFARTQKSEYTVHVKRHLPDSEKPFLCDEPSCTRGFVRHDELMTHKRTHTGEKPFECEQCGKKYTQPCHLKKHLGTHNRRTKSSQESDDDDDESDDSSSTSDKQEIDTDSETDEKQEIKVKPEKIKESFPSAFFSSDAHVDIKKTEMEKTCASDVANDLKSNGKSLSSFVPIKLIKPMMEEIYSKADEYDDSISVKVPVKENLITEASDEYDPRFEEFVMKELKVEKIHTKADEYNDSIKVKFPVKEDLITQTSYEYDPRFEEFVMKELKVEAKMIDKPDSSGEPISISAAIHPLVSAISENKIKPESNDHSINSDVLVKQEIKQEMTVEQFEEFVMKELKDEPEIPVIYSYEPNSMSAAIHRLTVPIPMNDIKLESKLKNHIQSKSSKKKSKKNSKKKSKNKSKEKSKHKHNVQSEAKRKEKRHKCSVEGCDMAFSVPYALKRHSWVHTKVKNYECDKCKKKFLRTDHLAKHLKTHSRIPNDMSDR